MATERPPWEEAPPWETTEATPSEPSALAPVQTTVQPREVPPWEEAQAPQAPTLSAEPAPSPDEPSLIDKIGRMAKYAYENTPLSHKGQLKIGSEIAKGFDAVTFGMLKGVPQAAEAAFNANKDKEIPFITPGVKYILGQYTTLPFLNKLQNEILPPETSAPKDFNDMVLQGAGSALAFMGTGGLLQQAGMNPALATAALGAASGGSQQYEEALSMGASPNQAALAYAGGAAFGTTEAVEGAYFLNKFNTLTGGKLFEKIKNFGVGDESGPMLEAIKGFLTEATQEGIQQIGQNWVASDLAAYDPNRTLGENFWSNALSGGIVGSLVGGGYGLVRRAEVNKVLQAFDADRTSRMASGDPINWIEGDFTPVGDLVMLREIAANMQRAMQSQIAEVRATDGHLVGDNTLIPLDKQKPEYLGVSTSSAFDYVSPILDLPIDKNVEKALPPSVQTVGEALAHTPVVAHNVNPYEGIIFGLTTKINQIEDFMKKNDLTPEKITPESAFYPWLRKLEAMKKNRLELMAKAQISSRILAQAKSYAAAFREAISPDFKLVITNGPTTEGQESFAGSFIRTNDALINGMPTPVGVVYIDFDKLATEVYNSKKMGLSEEANRVRRRLFETMNHELGHAIAVNTLNKIYSDFRGSDPAAKQAAVDTITLLTGEYNRWLKDAAQNKQSFYLLTAVSPERSISMSQGAHTPVKEEAIFNQPMTAPFPNRWPKKGYLLSFDEFFAEMTARLAAQGVFATGTFSEQPVIGRYFRPVIEQYQKLFELMPSFAKSQYGGDWKMYLQSQMLSHKIRAEFEKVQNADLGNIVAALRGKLGGFSREAFAGLQEHLDRFDRLIGWGFNLLQLAKANPHIGELQEYLHSTAAWAEYQRNFMADANPTIKSWRSLEKGEASQLTDVLYAEALERRRLDATELATRLTTEGLAVYTQIREQLDRVLEEMRGVALREALMSFTGNEEALKEETNGINADFDRLKNEGYFPFIRFGKFTITARALEALEYRGDNYKKGQLIAFPTFETERERDAVLAEIRKELGAKASVASSVMRETDFVIQGMPRALLRSLRTKLEAAGNLSVDQQNAFERVMAETAPFRNFRKHFLKKKGIHGYSEDAIRSFAHYMRSAAGHIARVRFNDALRGPIERVQHGVEIIKETGGRADERQEIRHWLDRHFSYIMNPANEWAALRGVGFVAYLGFNIKSALINSTQLLTTVAPYLAARYGDKEAITALTKATWSLKDWISKRKDFIAAMPDDQGKITRPNDNLRRVGEMIARGIHEGWLDQSLATELAIAASENNLDRGLYLPKVRRFWHEVSRYSALPFHLVEKMNRYITAIAAHDLEFKASGSQEKAILAARQANWSANYENARWNRPEFLRGKKSVLFLFGNYLQNTLYFATHDKGAVRYWLMMLILGGLMGLPGAEDVADLADFAATFLNRLLGLSSPKTQLRREAREHLEELGLNPDLVLHGLSQDSFGLGHVGELTGIPIPHLDVSRSVGMGDVLPLTEVPSMLMQSDPNDVLAAAARGVGGAGTNLVESFYSNLLKPEPDAWRKAERLLPFVAAKNVLKATRLATQGSEKTQAGNVIAEFDPHDLRDQLELIGAGLGFSPSKLTLGWERQIAVADMTQYYKVQQEGLLRQLDWAFLQEDREAKADALEAIREYNKQVPQPEMQIGTKTIRDSLKSYLQKRAIAGAGVAGEKKYRRLQQQVESSYPNPLQQRSDHTDPANPP